MTYFESIGVDYQYNATNITEAKHALKKSCDICSKTGKHITCDRCAIASVHNIITNIFK
jgi:hypothetical protein